MKKKLKCILLVDDNFHDNFFHKISINELDITEKIEVANDGIEALEFLSTEKKNSPELIFLDINMPRMNGWEFLEEYKKLECIDKTKIIIIMLTTSGNPSDIKKANELTELSGYLTKPLTIEVLGEIIHKHFPNYNFGCKQKNALNF